MKSEQNHVARKRFGQNFLVSPGVVQKIVDAIAPRAADAVVEIGPGLGALTDPLLQRLYHLHVIELDRDLCARLRQRYPAERLTLHEGDALEFDFASLYHGKKLKIVGNLPYNISSPLLFHLVDFVDSVDEMHFMLQKEVVDRMVAEPGSHEFGRLSVMLQYHYYMERLFVVAPGSFNPAPKVDSAIVRMIPRPTAKVGAGETDNQTVRDAALFARIVTMAFSQRRKMLRNTLRSLIDADRLQALAIAPTARAEELAVEDYVRLANALATDAAD